ncbi:MAG: type II toxin-antitoxin system VapC family toxin [Nitrososphaerota archaeon]|nr:type II toxin-antitoxin system VapC family toxin [Nitrososphaerota archaeon]
MTRFFTAIQGGGVGRLRGRSDLVSVFLDTGFFVALANASDRDHEEMVSLSDRIRNGEFGQPYTSDYVFDEAVTTALVRTGRMGKAIEIGRMILGYEKEKIAPLARLLRVDESVFRKAWENFTSPKFKEKDLSFTDHSIMVQMKELGIETIASMDSGFDGLVSRIF